MDAHFVGIDVSKDRLDVHVRPSGEAFAVARNGEGLAELVERLRGACPGVIAVEATGGFETVVAGGLASAGLPVVVVNPAQVRHFAQASASAPRPTRSTPRSSPASSRRPSRRCGRCRTRRPACSPIWSRGGARSSR